ncbi:hypothetical protein Taro_011604 [Colocasia esculenta]|uniref:Uncharacterized protein n=1 Tax=Colocasia esculenta TaxID=4460 RepID=A0A843UBB8_COLES|nr:hypothetical protein [Colocasia esculenta]
MKLSLGSPKKPPNLLAPGPWSISTAGPSAPSWGMGTGRRGPTRGVTERRLPDGQQWNVSLVRGYGMGPTSNMHGSTPHQLEVFKMGRCKDLPDGSERWVDEESRRRYEAMTQMIAPSSDVDAESHTTTTPEDTFILVMGKDRPGRVRCAGSGETLSTWCGSTGTSSCLERERIMQEQLKAQEEKLKAQAEKMNQMEEKISQLENVASKVDEMSLLLSQIQASQARTQHVPPPI